MARAGCMDHLVDFYSIIRLSISLSALQESSVSKHVCWSEECDTRSGCDYGRFRSRGWGACLSQSKVCNSTLDEYERRDGTAEETKSQRLCQHAHYQYYGSAQHWCLCMRKNDRHSSSPRFLYVLLSTCRRCMYGYLNAIISCFKIGALRLWKCQCVLDFQVRNPLESGCHVGRASIMLTLTVLVLDCVQDLYTPHAW